MLGVMLRRGAALGFALAVLAASGAVEAQVPGPPPESTEIATCLCLRQAVSVLSADVQARQQAYNASRDELARIDAEMERARGAMDVNNPQSVAQFRQLLEQRDAALRREQGPIFTDLSAVTAHYNARVNEYNARCTSQPQNPALAAQVQATLSCPPP